MKPFLFLYILLHLIPHLSLAQNSWIIKNVDIIPMHTDTILEQHMIYIEAGIIMDMGKKLTYAGVEEIDAKGGYLMPGLIDMHVHLQDKKELGLYLAHGVTAIRNMQGMPWHVRVKKQIQAGKLSGPFMLTSSPQLTGPSDKNATRRKLTDPTQARKFVQKYKKQGYDFIKTYNRLEKDAFEEVIKVSRELEIPIVAHPSFKVDYSYHFKPEIVSIEHSEDIFQIALAFKRDSLALEHILEPFAQSGIAHCPTLSVFYRYTQMLDPEYLILSSPQSSFLNPFFRKRSQKTYQALIDQAQKVDSFPMKIDKQHAFHVYILRKLYEAGVPIICGTDAGILFNPAGSSIHDELSLYLEAGMSRFEALQTATSTPASLHPGYEEFGSIEKGKIANLVLYQKNPLESFESLKEPQCVMVKGNIHSKEQLETYKEKALKRRNGFFTWLRYGGYILAGK